MASNVITEGVPTGPESKNPRKGSTHRKPVAFTLRTLFPTSRPFERVGDLGERLGNEFLY